MIYLLFFLSSFLIQIMFLNMLIAIMGDAFDQATEKREKDYAPHMLEPKSKLVLDDSND